MAKEVGPRAVYKSSAVEWLDDYLQDPANYAEALDLLRNHPEALSDITELFERDGRGLDGPNTSAGFKDRWLAESGRFAAHPVEEAMRQGYTLAIERAIEKQVPIETFWVAGFSDAFEIHVCEGARQITVHVFLPPVDEQGSRNAKRSKSWAVDGTGPAPRSSSGPDRTAD